jgi:tetratricopeptide (TPR) repeat protein
MRRTLLAVMVLAACSSSPKQDPEDETLARFDHAGDIAFDQEKPSQAATQFRAALARARTRDDARAIADTGFNLAAAELAQGQPRDAINTAHELQLELARRGVVDPDFDLISAVALFRLDDLASADRIAAGLTTGHDAARANAAWFLRGLIADAHNDRAGLQHAVSSLTPSAEPGDVAELQARLWHNAALALRAADLRRNKLDYRGMARDLALAAQLTPSAPEAADLYLRSGRSAAAQGDTADARIWLENARKLAADTALRSNVEQALHQLPLH